MLKPKHRVIRPRALNISLMLPATLQAAVTPWAGSGGQWRPAQAPALAGVSQAFVKGSNWHLEQSDLTSSPLESTIRAMTSCCSVQELQGTTAALTPLRDVIQEQ